MDDYHSNEEEGTCFQYSTNLCFPSSPSSSGKRKTTTRLLERVDSRQRFSLLASDVDLIHHVVNYECRFTPRTIQRRHSALVVSEDDGNNHPQLRRNHSASAVLLGRPVSSSISSSSSFDNFLWFSSSSFEEEDDDDPFLLSILEEKEEDDDDESNLHKEGEEEDDNNEWVNNFNRKLKSSNDSKFFPTKMVATTAAAVTTSSNRVVGNNKKNASTVQFVTMFCGTILGAVVANASFERLNVLDPGCGSIIALLQYAVAVAERLPKASTYIRKPYIPVQYHASFVVLQFTSTWLANTCLAYDLPFAHYLVIKNTNLVFTMIVGAIVLKEYYSPQQIMSVVLLSAGIILTVLSEQETRGEEEEGTNNNIDEIRIFNDDGQQQQRTMIGVMLCVLSTVSMAFLGTMQEYVFHRFKTKEGKAATAEALFYTHAFGLPLFFVSGATSSHILTLCSGWKKSVPLVLCNLTASVVCKYCVLGLVDVAGNLTTTMALTISRFLGILLSIFLLSSRDHPGALFWMGSAAVVSGTVSYMMTNTHK